MADSQEWCASFLPTAIGANKPTRPIRCVIFNNYQLENLDSANWYKKPEYRVGHPTSNKSNCCHSNPYRWLVPLFHTPFVLASVHDQVWPTSYPSIKKNLSITSDQPTIGTNHQRRIVQHPSSVTSANPQTIQQLNLCNWRQHLKRRTI